MKVEHSAAVKDGSTVDCWDKQWVVLMDVVTADYSVACWGK